MSAKEKLNIEILLLGIYKSWSSNLPISTRPRLGPHPRPHQQEVAVTVGPQTCADIVGANGPEIVNQDLKLACVFACVFA